MEETRQINMEVDRLQKLVAALGGLIVDLDNRLKPVLRDAPPCGSCEPDIGPLVPLAESIEAECKQVAKMYDFIGSIIDRLEI